MPRTPAEPDVANPPDQDYESTILPASMADLDREAVLVYLARREAALGRIGLPPPGMEGEESDAEIERRLAALGLGLLRSGEWHPSVAALLLFGRNPEVTLPQAQVKLARFRGEHVAGYIIDRAELGGGAASMIENVVQFVTRNMRVAGPIDGV